MNNKIIKLLLGDYFKWKNLSREDKVKRNHQIAKLYLDKGPSILSIYNALKAYFGGFNPKNPYLITGEAPSPGIKDSKNIIKLFRATGTSGKFIPSLDGTALYAGLWFTNNIRKPLRYASSTFKKAKINKVNNPVELLVVEIPKSDIEKFKASNILKGNKNIEYEPTEDFLIPLDYPRLRYTIEGLTGNLLNDMKLKLPIEKQGGSLNPANTRKWKHKNGGKAFVNGVSVSDSNPDAYKYVKKKIKKAAGGGNTLNWWLRNFEKINTIGNAISETLPSIVNSILKRKAASLEALANELSDNLSELELFNNYYTLEMENSNLSPIFVNGLIVNLSPIVALNKAYQVAWNKAKSEMLGIRLKTKLKNALLYKEANTDLTNSILGSVGKLALTGYELYLNKKLSTTSDIPKLATPTYLPYKYDMTAPFKKDYTKWLS